jgi:pyruvate ferredoxin oxidoreductase delta subunit
MSKKPDIKTWKDINVGGVIESGTSEHFHTGDWRGRVPIWKEENCTHCMICWTFCPDSAITAKDGKMTGINYDYCKGCGICAEECPVKVKALKAAGDEKLTAWDGSKNEAFAEKCCLMMVSIKEAKEKYNIGSGA